MQVVGVRVFKFDELGDEAKADAVARVREKLSTLWLQECRAVLAESGFEVHHAQGAPLAGLGFGVFFNGVARLAAGAVPAFLAGQKYVADLLAKYQVEATVIASGVIPAGITLALARVDGTTEQAPSSRDERAVTLLRQAIHRHLLGLHSKYFGPRRRDVLQDRNVWAVLRDPEALFLGCGQLLDLPAESVVARSFGLAEPVVGLLPLAERPAVTRPAWLAALRLAAAGGPQAAARLAVVRAWLAQNEETVAVAELEALERAAAAGSRYDRAMLLLLLLVFDAGRDAGGAGVGLVRL